MDISVTDIEQAINFWRARRPSTGEEHALSPEVDALATVYALMIHHRRRSLPLESLDQPVRQLLESWRQSRAAP